MALAHLLLLKGSMKALFTALALGLILAACDEEVSPGLVELVLFDQPVTCDAATDICLSAKGRQVPGELVRAGAYLSRQASQYGEGGLYLYFEIQRPGGAVALVEVDVPAGHGVGSISDRPHFLYQEYLHGRLVFRSQKARGRVEVPVDRGCACQDGRLELIFTDPGPDRKAGTGDDQERRLSRGLFGLLRETCRRSKALDVDKQVEVEVAGLFGCPSRGRRAPPSSSGGDDLPPVEVGCEPPEDDYYYEGCEGDTYEDGGCEGDTGDGWGDGDDYGGCEGDSSSGSDMSCEGEDSSGLDCEGDAYAATPGPKKSRQGRSSPPLGILLAFGVIFMARRRGRQRQRWRRRKQRPPP